MRSPGLRAGALALAGSTVFAELLTGGPAGPAQAASSTASAAGPHTKVLDFGTYCALIFMDRRIDESSGLATSTRQPDVVFTHNDSGDSARFFAVDDTTGRTRVTYRLPGVTAVDIEDMATGPGPDGHPSVWLADIGDNGAARSSVAVYVAREPYVGGAREQAATLTATFRLRYPDGPHDAETLLVDPVRRSAFVVTKSVTGRSGVYALPARPTGPGAVATMRRVGSVVFPLTGSRGGPLGPFGALTATGGSVQPDGRLLAIRTYTDVYLWRLGAGGVAAALRHPAGWRLRAPAQRQGEGVAFTQDDNRLLVSSEGVHSRVFRWEGPLPGWSGTAFDAYARRPQPRHPDVRHAGAPVFAIGLGAVAVLGMGVVGAALLLRWRREPG